MNERHDIHTSLAEMDRKLRELQHELAQVAARPEPAPAAPPPSAFPAPPPPQPGPPPYPVTPAYTPPPAAPAPTPPPAAVPPPPAPAWTGGGTSDALRMVQDAAARLAVMSRQIDELQRARDELQHSVGALATEIGSAAPPAMPAPPAAPAPPPGDVTAFRRAPTPPPVPEPPAPARAAPLAPVEDRPAVEPGPFAPTVAPAPPSAAAPAARAGGLSGVSPPPEGAANRNQFEGQVVVNAGPFTDIATLGAFEQALGRLPRAEEVYVRGFEGNRALIDLRLGGPVRLLDEMRQSVPFPFGVVEVGHGMVTINVDAPAGNSNPAVNLR